MSRPRALLVVILVAVGAIFVGQGSGLLRGSSVMVGDSRWAWIGGALVVAGVVLGANAIVRRRG